MFKRRNLKFVNYFLFIAIVAFFWLLTTKSVLAGCCICEGGCTEGGVELCSVPACKYYPQSCQLYLSQCPDQAQQPQPTQQPSNQSTPENETLPVIPQLQIQIPGFGGFTKDIQICLDEGKTLAECEKGHRGYAIPWIGEYIIAFYVFMVRAIAIIAICMIIWGGLEWILARGNASQISGAKSRIGSAIMGLIIIVSSNLILTTINPSLTIFPPLRIGMVERIESGGELSDTGVADQTSQGLYFKQCDSRWGGMAYTKGGSECNLCSSGCGATAVAIVLKSKGLDVTPQTVGQQAIGVGARKDCSGGTDTRGLIERMASTWGVRQETITDFNKAMDYLSRGSWLIVSIEKVPVSGQCANSTCGKGICFCNRHFVVLAGKTGDTIHVIDPSRRNITSFSTTDLRKYLSYMRFYNIWKE